MRIDLHKNKSPIFIYGSYWVLYSHFTFVACWTGLVARSTDWLCWNIIGLANGTSRIEEEEEIFPSELLRGSFPYLVLCCKKDPELFLDETLAPPSSNLELLLEFPWIGPWFTTKLLRFPQPPPLGVPARCCLDVLFSRRRG